MKKKNFRSVGEYIHDRCRNGAGRPFVKELSSARALSYNEFWKEIEGAVFYLNSHAVSKGDTVVLMMNNDINSLTMFMACLVTGIVPVPVNPSLVKEELNVIFKRSKAKATLDLRGEKRPYSAYTKILPVCGDLSDEKAYVMFTSGSTGAPKEVPVSHENMLSEIASMVAGYELGKNDKNLCILPMCHVSALYRNIFIPFDAGAETVIATELDLDDFWKTIDSEKINFVQVVPSILTELLMRADKIKGRHGATLKYIGSASAPHPASLLKAFEDRFGINVLQGYGMTEATCSITLNPVKKDLQKMGSVGLPLPANKIEIWSESNSPLAAGETGRVMIAGPNISKGCLAKEGKKRDGSSMTWLETGDIGYLDKDDFLWLLGRASTFIKRGAYRISPNEIENMIASSFPGFDIAVIGVPHSLLGEDIIAFMSGADKLTSREIIKIIKKKMASYKIPSEILFVDEIPRLGVGKVDRKKLKAAYMSAKSKRCYETKEKV